MHASTFLWLDLDSEDGCRVEITSGPSAPLLIMDMSQDGGRKILAEMLPLAVPQLNTAQSDLEIETHLAANLLSSGPLISRRVPDFDSRKLRC